MRIGSAEKRAFWRGWAFGIFFDVFAAAVVAFFIAEPGNWLVTTGVIWLIIEVADIALMILRTLKLFVGAKLGMFNSAREGFRTLLEQNDLPPPQPYEVSVDDYLEVAATREDVTPAVRVAAAQLFGFRVGMRSFAGVVRYSILDQMHEKGLQDYAGR